MLELDVESKIIKKLLVIKEICSGLPPELDGWNVCSQEHTHALYKYGTNRHSHPIINHTSYQDSDRMACITAH